MTKKIDKSELVDLVIGDIKNDIESGDLTAVAELLGFTPIENLLGYLPEEVSNKVSVDADLGFIIVRYSTDHSSWMTPYTNKEIALKHIIDNINIHFSDKDESELVDFHEEAKRVMVDGDESAEFDSLNIEIEYGATMSAM